MIDLKDAATFLRLCETCNLTRTATLCHVSPSTLSRTLNKLEQTVGVKLCLRDKKGVSITAEGKKFEQFARKTLNEYRLLQNSIQHHLGSLKGAVKIFCSVTASYLFIPRLLNELHLREPNLEVKIETGDPADALDKLEKDQGLDFAISALPNEIPAHIGYIDLVSFPLVLIAPKKPLFNAPTNSLDFEAYDLNEVPFVMPEHGQLRYEVKKWFSSLEIKPSVYTEIAGHEAMVSLTGLGLGLSVVPKLVLELSPFRSEVITLKVLPWSDFRVALCYLKKRLTEKKIATVAALTEQLAPSFEPDLTRRRDNGN